MANPGKNDHRDNSIMDSIAALRSVLMLDTPIRDALAVGNDNSNYNNNQQSQKLSFSMAHVSTPSSRTTSVYPPSTPSPLAQVRKELSLQRSPEVQESGTKVLAKKIQLLEASHAELEQRLNAEVDQREILKTTNDRLLQFQMQQASELEQIAESRDKLREETIKLQKTLESERNSHSRNVAFIQNTNSGAIQSEHLREKEHFQAEIEHLRKQLQKSDRRSTESELLVKTLTTEVETLNSELKKLREAHELDLQEKNEDHKKKVTDLRSKIEQTESGLVAQINNERKTAEANFEKLQKVQRNRAKLREDHALERGKMKDELAQLRGSLEKAIVERQDSEHKLQEVSNEVHRLREQIANEQISKKESNVEVVKLNEESNEDSTKSKLVTNVSTDFKAENKALNEQLQQVKQSRNQLENELQEAYMELNGLKQNLEEAERIELLNEDLQEQLKTLKFDATAKEQLLLQRELKRANEKLVELQEKLAISSKSNQKRLCDVATHRERARQLEVQLGETAIVENSFVLLQETGERKRGNDSELSPPKRIKARYTSEDEDSIVL